MSKRANEIKRALYALVILILCIVLFILVGNTLQTSKKFNNTFYYLLKGPPSSDLQNFADKYCNGMIMHNGQSWGACERANWISAYVTEHNVKSILPPPKKLVNLANQYCDGALSYDVSGWIACGNIMDYRLDEIETSPPKIILDFAKNNCNKEIRYDENGWGACIGFTPVTEADILRCGSKVPSKKVTRENTIKLMGGRPHRPGDYGGYIIMDMTPVCLKNDTWGHGAATLN